MCMFLLQGRVAQPRSPFSASHPGPESSHSDFIKKHLQANISRAADVWNPLHVSLVMTITGNSTPLLSTQQPASYLDAS